MSSPDVDVNQLMADLSHGLCRHGTMSSACHEIAQFWASQVGFEVMQILHVSKLHNKDWFMSRGL